MRGKWTGFGMASLFTGMVLFAWGCRAGPRRGEEGFVPLQCDTELAAWERLRQGEWSVDGGTIVGRQSEGYSGGWLFTKDEFGDVEVAFEFRVTPGGNSGVSVRYPGKGSPSKLGYELQIGDVDPDYPTGSIFGLKPAPEGLLRRNSWNEGRIIAKGHRIMTFVNGRPAAEATGDRGLKGRIAIQVHSGEEYKGIRVEFRRMRVRTPGP